MSASPRMEAEEAGIRRMILEEPENDTPRLILADWYEDSGQQAQAEVIRFLIANPWASRRFHVTPTGGARLVSQPAPALIGITNTDYAAMACLATDLVLPIRFGWYVTLRRGLIEGVEMTQKQFLAHAGAIFQAAPVTQVGLTDKKPWKICGRRHCAWYRAGGDIDAHRRWAIDQILWPFLTGHPLARPIDHVRHHHSPEKARIALSLACTSFGRGLVGLP